METAKQSRLKDVVIIFAFPVAAALLIWSITAAHSSASRSAGLTMLVATASFVLLPALVALRISSSAGRGSIILQWIESIIAGAWISLGCFMWTAEYIPFLYSLCIAVVTGVLFALLPYWAMHCSQFRRLK